MKIIINHKTHLTYKEIKSYEKKIRNLDVIILPSLCYLPLFNKGIYTLGSQDISKFEEENRTGEINGKQLKSLSVKYSLIGHSDRKNYNNETIEDFKSKIKNCLNNNIVPLYCIGEKQLETKYEEIYNQLDEVLSTYNDNIIIIYEPINNIENDNPDLKDLENTIYNIKKYIKEKYNKNLPIFYGGGIRQNNIEYIEKIKDLEGIIISTESLNINSLKKLYKKIKRNKK